jgi:hypothetical protein
MTILVLLGQVFGFDGQRKGFILGGGAGFSINFLKYNWALSGNGIDRSRESNWNRFGIAADLKIGYAFTNQLEIFYSNKVSIIPGLDSTVPAFSLNSLSMNFYFKEQGPSTFISAGVGLMVNGYPFVQGSIVRTGFGFHIGIGYEISKHWALILDYMYGAPEDTYEAFGSREYSQYKISTVRASIIVTAF